MIKLLVDAPDGLQKLIEIDKTGKYFDESLVLWDERIDGAFPSDQVVNIGGLNRAGEDLVLDTIKADANQAILDSIQAQENAEQQELSDVVATDIDLMIDNLDKPQLKRVIKWLVKKALKN